MVDPVADERDGLLKYLDHQRGLLRLTAYGLTDEQARLTPTASTLSIGGLIKHLAVAEENWTVYTVGGKQRPDNTMADRNKRHRAGFLMGPDDTLAGLLDNYAAVARCSDEILTALDLDHPVPVPQNVPWYPDDLKFWSIRWVLLHLIQETARHAGHADIIRESIDGATSVPLMAAAENWVESGWVAPWRKGS
jgi:hypothetical protein